MFLKDSFIISEYIEWLITKKQLKPSSLRVYRIVCVVFISENYDRLDDINAYNDYIIKKGIKQRSPHVHAMLKSFIQFYIQDAGKRHTMIENLITPEFFDGPLTEKKYLSEDQIINVINSLQKPKFKIVSLIQNITGARAGDVLSIKRGNIIPELYEGKNVLKIVIDGKGNKRNVVYIHDPLIQTLIMDYIIKHIENIDFYFLNKYTNWYHSVHGKEAMLIKNNYKAYMRDLDRALKLNGLSSKEFGTHDYRRCFARRVWSKYKDLVILQDLLNHQNPATTIRYLKQSGLKNIDYHKEMQTS